MNAAREFIQLTRELGWDSPTELCERWEINRKTVYNWREKGPPKYVLDYLKLALKVRKSLRDTEVW